MSRMFLDEKNMLRLQFFANKECTHKVQSITNTHYYAIQIMWETE